jgi:OPT family oligopeptide transporter
MKKGRDPENKTSGKGTSSGGGHTGAAGSSEATGKPLTAHEIELKWYREVYQGDNMPQLTLRAVLMGGILGCFMSLSNLYVGLKTGWALGVAITACILSFAIHRFLMVIMPGIVKTEMSILENNCMQSTASSAGYSTGGTMVSAISAYLLITGSHMDPWILLLWTFLLASLGVFLAIPMKRQMINIEQLPFPSGTAAAETLRSLHSKGKEAMHKATSLAIAGGLGTIVAVFRDAIPRIPAEFKIPGVIAGRPLSQYTINFESSTIMYAAGAIMGWKVAWSLLLGAAINYALLAPWIVDLGGIDGTKLSYRTIVGWSTWTGGSIMVTSGLVFFLMQGAAIKRAFSGLTKGLKGKDKSAPENPLDRIEVPTSWFLTGVGLSGLGCALVLYYAFDTSVTMGIIAVLMTGILSLVACRVTGESDVTPVGAMGKITQLTFGILAPAKVVTNLMTAAVTAGAAGSSADLLVDLKSGYLLGANPRKQFIAQYVGIFFGCAVVVPAFYILVPDAASLGTDKWPAPSAQVWAAVARLLGSGFEALHPTARWGMLIGGIIGVLLPFMETYAPERLKKFIPSATGVGLAMVIPFYNSLSMFVGALIVKIMRKKTPDVSEKYTIPVASGFIAGESIAGVVIALLAASGILG